MWKILEPRLSFPAAGPSDAGTAELNADIMDSGRARRSGYDLQAAAGAGLIRTCSQTVKP